MRIPGALEALRQECDAVSGVVLGLSEDGFGKPTRCPAWNARELLAHMYRDVERTIVGLHEDPPEVVDTDAVSYWRSYDPVSDAASIADRAKLRAASYGTGRELAIAWDDLWRRALDLAGGTDSSRPIRTWGPVLSLEEFLKTRVVEITVHGADLADALRLDPWATEEGLSITGTILRALLGGDPQEGLGWDELAFVEKGTGRQALTHDEAALLGAAAGRFPLIS